MNDFETDLEAEKLSYIFTVESPTSSGILRTLYDAGKRLSWSIFNGTIKLWCTDFDGFDHEAMDTYVGEDEAVKTGYLLKEGIRVQDSRQFTAVEKEAIRKALNRYLKIN